MHCITSADSRVQLREAYRSNKAVINGLRAEFEGNANFPREFEPLIQLNAEETQIIQSFYDMKLSISGLRKKRIDEETFDAESKNLNQAYLNAKSIYENKINLFQEIENECFKPNNNLKVKELTQKQLNAYYETLSKAYSDYKKIVLLCYQIDPKNMDPYLVVDLEAKLSNLDTFYKGAYPEVAHQFTKIFLRAESLIKKRILFPYSFQKASENFANIFASDKERPDDWKGFARGGTCYQIYAEEIGPPHSDHLTYAEYIKICPKLEKRGFDSKTYEAFVYFEAAFQNKPDDLDQGEFNKYLSALKFYNPPKDIYEHSQRCQISIREKRIEAKLKTLNNTLNNTTDQTCEGFKVDLLQAHEYYQQISQACRRCEDAISQCIQNPFQESPEMIAVRKNLENLIQLYEKVRRQVEQLSQQIEEEKSKDHHIKLLENQLTLLGSVFRLIKKITNCAVFCTINKVQNRPVYVGTLFSDLTSLLVGTISKYLQVGEQPPRFIYTDLKQYQSYKKEYQEIIAKLAMMDPHDPETYFTGELGDLLRNCQDFVAGGYHYMFYEEKFGPPSNSYLNETECYQLKSELTNRGDCNDLNTYLAPLIYGKQLDEEPIFYSALTNERFILCSHSCETGILSNFLSHLLPETVAEELKRYGLPQTTIDLEFDGCSIGEPAGLGRDTGLEFLMDALMRDFPFMHCIAYEWLEPFPNEDEDNSYFVRGNISPNFGKIHTQKSSLGWICFRDPFTEGIGRLPIKNYSGRQF